MTSFTYSGDITKAAQWLPFAKSRQMWMAKIGAMTQSYNPVSGVMITVQTVPLHIHIAVIGGGNYHFMSRPSLPDAIYNSFIGTAPTGRNEDSHVVTSLVSQQAPTVLAYGAPEADRHVWYGANRETVVSGYGTKYMTGRVPHYLSNGRSGTPELYIGNVELFSNGKSSYKSPFDAFNGFKAGNYLIGLDVDGGYKYAAIGAADFAESDAGIVLSNVDSSAFESVIRHDSEGSVLTTSPTPSADPLLRYELRYSSHALVTGYDTCYAHWSINKAGTAACGVCYVNYSVSYKAHWIYGEPPHHDAGDPVPGYDEVKTVTVPYLIELDITATTGISITPTVTPYPQASNNGFFLYGADYYYPAAGAAVENELLLWGLEGFDHEIAGNYYADDSPVNHGMDISLVVKSSSTEYVRDLFNYKSEHATGLGNIDGFKITGYVTAIDASTLTYAVYEFHSVYGKRLRVHSNGYDVVKTNLPAGAVLTALNAGGYVDELLTTSTPNITWSMWYFVNLSTPLIVNPINGELFFYADFPVFYGPSVESAWRVDFYAAFKASYYDLYYEYHALSSKAVNVELEGSRHCVAAALIL